MWPDMTASNPPQLTRAFWRSVSSPWWRAILKLLASISANRPRIWQFWVSLKRFLRSSWSPSLLPKTPMSLQFRVLNLAMVNGDV